MLCSDENNQFSVFDERPKKLFVDPNVCEYVDFGESFLQLWMGSAVHKNYKYKKNLNMG